MNRKIKYLAFLLIVIFIGSLNVEAYVCKRASSLHTSGNKTYGRLGSGSTLTVGDAFDCDVNGDGTFDSTNERFYYVSKLIDIGSYGYYGTYDDYAVLIYYNNVGVKNIYGYYGATPTTAIEQLPNNWSNVSLRNSTRQIYDESNNNKGSIDYGRDNTSRLISYQELSNGCGPFSGHADLALACPFMYENTSNDDDNYWLETSTENFSAWAVGVEYGSINPVRSDYMGVQYKIRPVIEVPITDIASDDTALSDIKAYNNETNELVSLNSIVDNEYFTTVDDDVKKVRIEPEVTNNATYKINGSTSNIVNLSDGLNTITVELTSEDGRNSEIYTIKINRVVPVDCSFPVRSVSLKVGQTVNYSEFYENGTRFLITDTSIATITNGIIKAKKVGTTNIKIYYDECPVKTTTITVVQADTKIEKTKSLEIALNDTIDLNEYVKNYDINSWRVSDNKIIKIENGKATGLKVGEATVTASGDNIKYTFIIKVLNKVSSSSGDNGVSLLTNDVNEKIEASKLNEDSDQYKDAKNSIKGAIKIEVYDLKITSDGTKSVEFNIPDGMNRENVAVYYLDGNKYVRVDAEIVNGKIQVKNARTGIYVIAEFNQSTGITDENASTKIVKDIDNPKTGNKLPVVLALIGYLSIVGIAVYLKKKNKLSRI